MEGRRKFILKAGFAVASIPFLNSFSANAKTLPTFNSLKIPKALKKGSKIAVIAPGGAIFNEDSVLKCKEKLASMGLTMIAGKTLSTKNGYLSDTDENRAKEIMDMFLDPDIDGILAMRGGSGCARLLPLLDYDLIKDNCKPFIGMSDITALLNAFYSQIGMVSFHGPVGYSSWTDYSKKYFISTIINKEETTYQLPSKKSTFYTIKEGIASGELIGGNLTVFSQLTGTPYLPDPNGKILFLEDINEEPYRIDRMIMQLKLAGFLSQLNGIVIGECRGCVPEEPEKSFSLKEVLTHHFSSLNIPVYYGARFGHVKDKWTFPIGIKAEMNSKTGTIKLLNPAVN